MVFSILCPCLLLPRVWLVPTLLPWYFLVSDLARQVCDIYAGMMATVPGTFMQTKGQFKKNVDFLLKEIHNVFVATGNCTFVTPTGPVRV